MANEIQRTNMSNDKKVRNIQADPKNANNTLYSKMDIFKFFQTQCAGWDSAGGKLTRAAVLPYFLYKLLPFSRKNKTNVTAVTLVDIYRSLYSLSVLRLSAVELASFVYRTHIFRCAL